MTKGLTESLCGRRGLHHLHDPLKVSIRNNPAEILRPLWVISEPVLDKLLGGLQEPLLRLLRAQEVVWRDALQKYILMIVTK